MCSPLLTSTTCRYLKVSLTSRQALRTNWWWAVSHCRLQCHQVRSSTPRNSSHELYAACYQVLLTQFSLNILVAFHCLLARRVRFRHWSYNFSYNGGAVWVGSESANATWLIEDASSMSEGAYTCNATNSAGTSSATTYLDITGDDIRVHSSSPVHRL